MTVMLWGSDIVPDGGQVEAAMLSYFENESGIRSWESLEEIVGETASYWSTIADLCLAGF